MEDKSKLNMISLLALVVAMGSAAVAQDVTYNNVTVTNMLEVSGQDDVGQESSVGIEGEPPIIIDQGNGTSKLFTRSSYIVVNVTNATSGAVTADINGDVELKTKVVEVTTSRYSIYAEKIIDNNTLEDLGEQILYRAGSGGSNTVGTLLEDGGGNLIPVNTGNPDTAKWFINLGDLLPAHYDLITDDPVVLSVTGGNLQVGGDANVDGTLTVDGTDVMGAIGDAAALADLAAYNAAAANEPADAPADAPADEPYQASSADPFVLAGDMASGFMGENYVISWSTVAGVQYQIQSSVDLVEWEPVGVPFVGTGSTMNWANAIADSQCYYRVVVVD